MPRSSQNEFTARIRRLVESVRGDIRSGALLPGDYLPSELELGRVYGLSKESVRKALDTLVKEGLIVKIRRVGTRVADPNEALRNSSREEAGSPPEREVLASPGRRPERFLTPARGEPVVIRLAHQSTLLEEARLTEAVEAFERSHPNIKVALMPTPFPLAYAEHGLADVVTLSAWDAWKLRERQDARMPLAPAPDTDTAHPLLDRPFLARDGRRIAAPLVYSPVVLGYNKRHFTEAGLEEPNGGWTWYTLLKASRFLSRRGGIGFAAHIQSINRWTVFLLQSGFRFAAGKARNPSDDPALWESLRLARDLIYGQSAAVPVWTEHDGDVERWFREGRVSMMMTTYFAMNRLLGSDLDYGAAPLPSLRNADTLLLVTGLGIRAGVERLDAAEALVRHLCGVETQTMIRRQTLSLPAHPLALAEKRELAGNRPAEATPDLATDWQRFKLYADLEASLDTLEAVREELKAYWSRLEDEAEAGERLEALLAGR